MMESSRGNLVLLLIAVISMTAHVSRAETRYYVKMRTNFTDPFKIMAATARLPENRTSATAAAAAAAASQDEKSRSTFRVDDDTMIRESLKANHERRNSFVESSTFDPDVLNKFLDDYANKIKTTTEKNYDFPFRVTKPALVVQQLNVESDDQREHISTTENDRETDKTTENAVNSTSDLSELNQQDLNDTVKRNKYFGGNANDDRNGWVTLDAIPWSKSKISKWQANPSSQRPWPETKLWEKPSGGKPWTSEFPSRPAYVNNEPWYDSQKPYRPDYQQDRPSSPRPAATRPSYFDDRFDENPSQAQKWPPERPASSWEKFPSSDSYRPNTDIITDDRPSNFPNSWDKYAHTSNKPSYNDNRDRFTSSSSINSNSYNSNNYNHNGNNDNEHHPPQHIEPHDWRDQQHNNFPSKFQLLSDNKPSASSSFGRPVGEPGHHSHSSGRPQQLSHYQYTPDHPPSHPSSGDGQWVLLSTNHGYSKSRGRSIKFDAINGDARIVEKLLNVTTKPARTTKQDNDGTIAVMTSKRQVRLTVLPSINGTNTTTSHGGLLEVERTFKTVDQSQKEYEAGKLTEAPPSPSSPSPIVLKKRPIRHTVAGRPSNSAVLAAVGAGMLPATMAMMIPMMLGRKRRSVSPEIPTKPRQREFSLEGSPDFRVNTERKRRKLSRLRRE